MMVLIWIVQRIIYPSFLYYSKENLIIWHRQYTKRFAFIVAPLMLVQLAVAVFDILSPDIYATLSITMITALWLSTFLMFVPVHNAISKGRTNTEMLLQLVRKNWLRTILWTLLFALSLLHFLNLL
ncbi:hypothetical protein ACFQ1M_05325 [Sungkyunkwania multivorans]|uniref:Uncharacterized protein n=1 Tax=Sungkyunkwania multivorans TaxID=1173618 RepID=A0ABW3CXP6_9FLAO